MAFVKYFLFQKLMCVGIIIVYIIYTDIMRVNSIVLYRQFFNLLNVVII